MKKKKPSFQRRLVKKIDFENFTQKIVDSCCKNIKKIGQFYVTLICSLNLGHFFFDTFLKNLTRLGNLVDRAFNCQSDFEHKI